MNNVLLISEQTLKKYTLINDNMDGVYILPAIQMAQDIDLDNAIGTKLCNKLKSLVMTGDITNNKDFADYKKLLDDYITPYLAWQTMTAVQISIDYTMTNSGVIQNEDEKKSHLDYKNAAALRNQYQKYANAFLTKLKNYLLSNSSKYPEYFQCEDYQQAEEGQLCSIYLGD
jgi:hypothetical protein